MGGLRWEWRGLHARNHEGTAYNSCMLARYVVCKPRQLFVGNALMYWEGFYMDIA